MPVIPLPPGYSWGFVVARFIHAIADTTEDVDRFPEARGSKGRAIFTPQNRFRKYVDKPTAFVQHEIVSARIENGILIDAEGEEGIWLISGEYNVSFQIEGGSVPGFSFVVTDEFTKSNPLDLVTHSPVVVPPGYIEVTRVIDRERAEAAASESEMYRDQAREFSQTETFEAYVSASETARDQSQTARNQSQSFANQASAHNTNAKGEAEAAALTKTQIEALLSDLPESFDDVATVQQLADAIATRSPTNHNHDGLYDPAGGRIFVPDSVDTPPSQYPDGISQSTAVSGAGFPTTVTILTIKRAPTRVLQIAVSVHSNLETESRTWIRYGYQFGDTDGWGPFTQLVSSDDSRLKLVSDASVNSTANALMRRDASGRSKVSLPNHVDDIASKRYVDDNAVPLHRAIPDGSINSRTEVGVWYQSGSTQVTTANNYPVNGSAGTLEVLPFGPTSSWRIQRWTEWGSRRLFGRAGNGTWNDWVEYPSVDRVKEMTDARIVTTNRFMRIDGRYVQYDSGWRNITNYINSPSTGELHIRRTLDTLYLRFINLALNPGTGLIQVVSDIPSGSWRPVSRDTFVLPRSNNSSYRNYFAIVSGHIVNWIGESAPNTSTFSDQVRPTATLSGTVQLAPGDPSVPDTLLGTPV